MTRYWLWVATYGPERHQVLMSSGSIEEVWAALESWQDSTDRDHEDWFVVREVTTVTRSVYRQGASV